MAEFLRPPKKGDPITSTFLGGVASNLNELTQQFRLPRDNDGGGTDDADLQDDSKETVDPFGTETWEERSRSTSTVRIFQDGSTTVFVDVERIDRITFTRPNGKTVTMRFNN